MRRLTRKKAVERLKNMLSKLDLDEKTVDELSEEVKRGIAERHGVRAR